MKRFFVVFALIAAACGGGDDESGDTSGQSTQATTGNGGNGDSGDSGDSGDGDNGDGTNDGGSNDGNGNGDDDPPDDDAADILGNPDLDLDELPDAIDDIAGVVSIGDCEAAGLKATFVPEGWMCRVLDNAPAGMDGFTMFMEGNDLNISVTDPSPFGAPCELLQACDTAEPVALSANFPDTTSLDVAGTTFIVGTHVSVDAELAITKFSALTPDETELVMAVLDAVELC